MSDEEFLSAFERCTLTAADWTHEAHVRMGWLKVSRYGYASALEQIRRGIQQFNDAVLKKDLAYHETITVAFTRLIAAARYSLPPTHDFAAFKQAHPILLDRKLSALLKHYRNETLFSQAAREVFVAPDLVPFPKL